MNVICGLVLPLQQKNEKKIRQHSKSICRHQCILQTFLPSPHPTHPPFCTMSRFFRAGESDSDDSDDYSDEISETESEDHTDDSEDDSDDDEPQQKRVAGRFETGAFSDSDSDDDAVRVVRSAKDKRFEEIEQAVTSMANGQKINDWVSAQNGKSWPPTYSHQPQHTTILRRISTNPLQMD